jgi:hypothetical protein
MFSRRACYFFVRPKAKFLEVCIFLGRPLKAPQVRRVIHGSRSRFANMLQIRHRDEVEAPITGWLREAYDVQDAVRKPSTGKRKAARTRRPVKKSKRR